MQGESVNYFKTGFASQLMLAESTRTHRDVLKIFWGEKKVFSALPAEIFYKMLFLEECLGGVGRRWSGGLGRQYALSINVRSPRLLRAFNALKPCPRGELPLLSLLLVPSRPVLVSPTWQGAPGEMTVSFQGAKIIFFLL